MRVLADGQTHRQTHTQTQTDFIICPMLYAIAMGQIITDIGSRHTCTASTVFDDRWVRYTLFPMNLILINLIKYENRKQNHRNCVGGHSQC